MVEHHSACRLTLHVRLLLPGSIAQGKNQLKSIASMPLSLNHYP
jgi:hypothetical protein